MFRTVLIVLVVVFSQNALACRGSVEPHEVERPFYSEIFVGEVTGITLTDYERFKAYQPPDRPLTEEETLSNVLVMSSTPVFEVRVVVERAFLGDPEKVEVVALGGCGVKLPELKERGLFFVRSGDTGIGVLESSAEFEGWVARVKGWQKERSN